MLTPERDGLTIQMYATGESTIASSATDHAGIQAGMTDGAGPCCQGHRPCPALATERRLEPV